MNKLLLAEIVKQALNEDLGSGDITTDAIFIDNFETKGNFVAKAPGVIAGLPVAATVFDQLDPSVRFNALIQDGSAVTAGMVFATVTGPVKSLLTGERLSLNFLQRLSGIATKTAFLKNLIKDYPARLVDTRKTTPGLRMLEKYAVRQGGGHNHRYNLSDAVLIKDNHIAACGSILEAVRRARQNVPHTVTIEVEVENEAEVRAALDAKADIIMLDNMTPEAMTEMVKLINGRALVEASGDIDENTIQKVAATGVDIISCGSLTHSVKALNLSLDFERL